MESPQSLEAVSVPESRGLDGIKAGLVCQDTDFSQLPVNGRRRHPGHEGLGGLQSERKILPQSLQHREVHRVQIQMQVSSNVLLGHPSQ